MLVDFNRNSAYQAAELLRQGKLVCLPTDTQYALACNAYNEQAVQVLIAAKQRKPDHPLPVLVRDLEQALEHAQFSEQALELAKKYWPGALTLVLQQREDSQLAAAVNNGFSTVALRQCNSQVIAKILALTDFPIVGTSANISGQLSSVNALELEEVFKDKVALVINSTRLLSARASTVVDLSTATTGIKVIRQGDLKVFV